jgi:hypothetical protein
MQSPSLQWSDSLTSSCPTTSISICWVRPSETWQGSTRLPGWGASVRRPGVGLRRSHRRTCCLSRALILVPRTDCMYLASRTMTGRAPRPVKLSEPGPSGKCPYAPPGDVAIHGPRWCPQLESEQDDLALLPAVPVVAAAGAEVGHLSAFMFGTRPSICASRAGRDTGPNEVDWRPAC